MFIVDCFDIGSKYYGKSNHNLFFELIKGINLLANSKHSIYQVSTFYWKIRYTVLKKFVKFMDQLHTSLRHSL